ncbi:branched-chain amino acid transport system substrate-binding protein [Nitrobacteraceae bacterium AZCC 2146]
MRDLARVRRHLAMAALFVALGSNVAAAQKKYDTGVSDTEIKIGNVMPYSGPASAYAAIGKTEAAYFKMINDNGGINGRQINFISYDDGFSPPKTVEQARKLIESDEVFVLFNVVGTAGNSAIQKYANLKKVPHLFISSGAARFDDPEHFPWSMAWWPGYKSEARIYARYILQKYPDKKIGILYQNDDSGKDYLAGLRDAFGPEASKKIALELPYEVTTPSVDSQVVQIKTANVDIFINLSTPKFAAQAIKKIAELGWRPVQFLGNASASTSTTMTAAGVEASKDIISAVYLKDPADSQWKNDEGIKEFRAFMTKYYPEGDQENGTTVFGYGAAKAFAEVLKKCGDNLTRDNIMKQMSSLDMEINVYLPGIKIKTSPTDYSPIDQLQLVRFNGQRFEPFGSVIDGK